MMVTEWSFPALDSDCPARTAAGCAWTREAQRAKCFTQFQTRMFRLPFVVGSNYFMWVDEPAQGISKSFPENSNYGLVSEQDQPYAPLCEAAAPAQPPRRRTAPGGRARRRHAARGRPVGRRPLVRPLAQDTAATDDAGTQRTHEG